jgi:hypothetical protein
MSCLRDRNNFRDSPVLVSGSPATPTYSSWAVDIPEPSSLSYLQSDLPSPNRHFQVLAPLWHTLSFL